MKNTLIIVVIVALLALGGWYYMNQQSPQGPEEADVTAGMPAPGMEGVDEMVVTGDESAPTVKEFTVEGGKFYFAPNTLTVKKGDTVRVTFKNKDGFHDFVIDEFNARTKQINGGQEETIEFVADKAGTFEYYCSVGTHRQMGMKGTLTVTE